VKVYQLTDAQGVASPQRWLSSMQHAGWKIIHLHRENLVRQALSTVIAFKRRGWHVRAGAAPQRGAPVDVRPEELQAALDQRLLARSMDASSLAGIEHVRVVYEQDLLDAGARQAAADRVFAHLGMPSAPVSVTLERTGADRLEDLVVSADELRAHFDGTEWRAWLDRP
jgi:LPS sulfotransferase NodH